MSNDLLDLAILQDDRKELKKKLEQLVTEFAQKYPKLKIEIDVAVIESFRHGIVNVRVEIAAEENSADGKSKWQRRLKEAHGKVNRHPHSRLCPKCFAELTEVVFSSFPPKNGHKCMKCGFTSIEE